MAFTISSSPHADEFSPRSESGQHERTNERTTAMQRAAPKLPPTAQQQDESLAAIMARRRAMADSNAAPPATPVKKEKTETIADPALRALLLKRQQGGGPPIESMLESKSAVPKGPSVWEKARDDLVSVDSGSMADSDEENIYSKEPSVGTDGEDQSDESAGGMEEEQLEQEDDDESSQSSGSRQSTESAASVGELSQQNDDSSIESSQGDSLAGSSQEEEDDESVASVQEEKSIGEASGRGPEDSVDRVDDSESVDNESRSASHSVADDILQEEDSESTAEGVSAQEERNVSVGDLSAAAEEISAHEIEEEEESQTSPQKKFSATGASVSTESYGKQQSSVEMNNLVESQDGPAEGNSVSSNLSVNDANESESVEEAADTICARSSGGDDSDKDDSSGGSQELLDEEESDEIEEVIVDEVMESSDEEVDDEAHGVAEEALSVGTHDETPFTESLDQVDGHSEPEDSHSSRSVSTRSSCDDRIQGDLDEAESVHGFQSESDGNSHSASSGRPDNEILNTSTDDHISVFDDNDVEHNAASAALSKRDRNPSDYDGFQPRMYGDSNEESAGELSAEVDEYPLTSQWLSHDDKSRSVPERDDSFFTDPPSVGSELTFDHTAVDVQKPEALSLLEQSLRTLDEERTVDLQETDQEQSTTLMSRAYGSKSDQSTVRSYDEQTIVSGDQSSLGGQQSFCDEETVYDTATTDGEQSRRTESNEYSESGESESEDSENEEFQQYYNEDFEDDSILEIDTLDSSVVSFESHDDVTGWGGSHTPHYKSSLLDQHMQTSDGSNNYQYSDDCEQSILGDLNVLGVVQEEGTVDESENDSSTVNSPRPASLASRDSEVSRKKDLRTHVGSAVYQVTEEDDEDSSADNSSSSSESENDIEIAKARVSKVSRRESGFCSWYILLALILLGSVVVGLGLGLLLLPRSKTQEVPPTPRPPYSIQDSPDLPDGQLALYRTICQHLRGDCIETLLASETPQSSAFHWLVNDSEANPKPTSLSDAGLVQRYAMATIYFSTKGVDWSQTTHWLSSKHECDWFTSVGFAPICDFDSKMLHTFVLENNNLQGEIPYEVSLLTSLREISLRNPGDGGPSIRGILPTFLGSLTHLTALSISGNRFASGIPSELGQLSSLEALDLSNNGLNGEIPPSLAGLTNLVKLNLQENHVSGDIHEDLFAKMKQLEEVRLDGNLFSGLPDSLGALVSLRVLDVANNHLSTFPRQVTELTALLELDLSENDFRGRLPAQLGRLRNIESLDLSGNRFSGPFPVEYCNLTQLRRQLNLSFNDLTGTLPSRLGQLTRIERLLLTGNRLSGTIPAELALAISMEELRLDQNDFVGAMPTEICLLYDETEPSAYIDCAEVSAATCFKHCCTDGAGCRCQYEKTDPFRCIEGLQ